MPHTLMPCSKFVPPIRIPLTAALIMSGVCRISDSAVVTRSPNAFTSLWLALLEIAVAFCVMLV